MAREPAFNSGKVADVPSQSIPASSHSTDQPVAGSGGAAARFGSFYAAIAGFILGGLETLADQRAAAQADRRASSAQGHRRSVRTKRGFLA